jgi:phage N-6-adenine-methyltransferase
MALIKSMVSSKSNEWATPQKLFEYLNKQWNFTLDPSATQENAKCAKFYTINDDGLSKSWAGERVFCNPPYGGHTKEWLQKAVDETKNGVVSVFLIVSSTDRSYWHDLISRHASNIFFLRGRVKFGGSKSTAPFASAIVVFKPEREKTEIDFLDIREFHQ